MAGGQDLNTHCINGAAGNKQLTVEKHNNSRDFIR